MTTNTAEKLAGRVGEVSKDKEKLEKRRALGGGLESLLPGPRVVAPVPRPVPADEPIAIQAVVEEGAVSPLFAKDAKDGAPSVASLPEAAEPRSGGQPGAAVPTQTAVP